MNEKINFSNYSVAIRIGDVIKSIDLDIFTTFCDRFLFEEINDLVAQSPVSTLIYSGVRNKTRFSLQITPKLD